MGRTDRRMRSLAIRGAQVGPRGPMGCLLVQVLAVGLMWSSAVSAPVHAESEARPPPSHGGEGSETLARRHFERGLQLASRARFREAEREFVDAWALSPRPSVAFNLATVRYRLGDYVAALAALNDYATVADRMHSHQAEAWRLRGMLEQRVARVTLELAPATARVFVDGTERPEKGQRRQLLLDPGAHEVKVVARRHRQATERITVAAGSVLSLSITLRATPRTPTTVTDHHSRTWGWVALGTGAAGALSLLVSGGFSLAALGRDGASEPDCDGNLCAPDGHAARTTARRYGDVATVTGIAGGALLASGFIVYLTVLLGDDASAPPAPVNALLSPELVGAQIQGRF